MGPKNGEFTIKDALGTMLSGGQKNRIEGVSQLKDIFRHNQKSPSLDVLDDGGYHSIFEALFQVARAEKQAYLAAKNSGQKTKAERALTACSDVLRITIKAGADKLNYKTVQAVIEHVTQLLPVATGEYCAGLSQFYLKTLGSLFEHEAHVEHLKDDDWLSIVDFCLQGIEQYNSDSSSEIMTSSRTFSNLTANTSSSAHASSTKLSMRTVGDGNPASSVTKRNSEELLHCLVRLISPSNAPVHERAEPIYHGIMHFLNSHGSFVSSIHQVAFSGLNSMLAATTADRTSLSRSLALRLIPVISRLWSLKLASKDEMLNSVKDEMLITILLLRLPMEHILDSLDAIDFRPKTENLEAVLRMEYMKRLQSDQLQLDDLDMAISVDDTSSGTSIHAGTLRLRSFTPRAERNWAILTVLSILDRLLHTGHDRLASNMDDNNEEIESPTYPRKRRRLTRRFDNFITRIASQNSGEQTVALQTLFFLLPETELSQQDLNGLLEHLARRVVDRQRYIGSWAMLCIASCAYQDLAHGSSCSFDWTQLWHTVSRMITTAATCRAACYLLHSMMANGLVVYQDIAEDIDAILIAPETSAPAIVTDSSLSLMTHLLSSRNMEAPGGSLAAGHHVIRWISARWNPADKLFAACCAVDVHPIDILSLFRTSLGLSTLRLSARGHAPHGIIGQTWIRDLRKEYMIRYLLLLKNLPKKIATCSKCSSASSLYDLDRLSDSSAHGQPTRRLILELFLPRFQLLLEDWVSHSSEESTQVSTDTIRSTASAHVFGDLILSLIADSRLQELRDQLENILKSLEECILAQLRDIGDTQDLVESTVQAIQPYLPATISADLTHLAQNIPLLLKFFTMIADHPSLRHSPSADVAAPASNDPMDLDMFDSQRSRSKGAESKNSVARQDLAMALSPAAFYDTTAARLILVSSIFKTDNNVNRIPLEFVDYLTLLKPTDTLLCRNMLRDALRADFTIDTRDASRLIDHIADILASPNYACCEVAQGLCLDTLTSLVSAWINPADEGLGGVATQLYEWFISKVLPKRRPSSNVQIGLADLCYEIMRLQPAYGEGRQVPSARSCLFDILQKGPMCVKFHIAERLPSLFGMYVLKRHNDILIDVLESLPSDPDWAEGIAFRLQVLGSLASKWPTLIRLCTYYILEVPGQLADSIKHATRCVAEVFQALGLENVQDLFRLFASQLLYTWLATERLDKIPYQIFGYTSLQDLVRDNQEEVTALMIMRNQDDGVADLVQMLGMPLEQLIQQCFSKVIAYSVGHDISVPQSTNVKKYVSGEARVRKLLGKEVFFDLVNKHFADIVALFFALIDQEEHIVEKSFAKDPRLVYAVRAMNDIKSMSSSEVALPPNQQPAFKSKYLTSEIEHLCGRTEHEVGALYTPSMTVFIARHILETIHPALGSLHACAALRKLRVLVALSGPTSLEGYPLEMLLQAIKPFITDPECANDAIGLAQYLFARGSQYLSTTPTFVAGISLTVLASLRAFLESIPASTTQQSQYRSTLSKAQSFHVWLGSYLAEYDPPMLDGDYKAALRAIFDSAHAFRSGGNADIGTAESDLLLELLEDDRSGRRLLNKPSRNLAISLLYGNFQQPTSFRNDVLGFDDRAVAYAATVWNLCQEAPISKSLLIWAAKVLGRSFAATGHIHQELLQESGLNRMMDITKLLPRQRSSKACILHLLQMLTLGDEPRTVGLVEAVLRSIVTRPDMLADNINGTLDDDGLSKTLSEALFRASDWTPYQVPPSDNIIFKTDPPHDPYGLDSILETYWPRRLAITLVMSVPSDAVLFALQRPLQNIDGFAEQAFPFIVHLVLSLQMEGSRVVNRQLSKALKSWLERKDIPNTAHTKLLINTLLYLRTQQLPRESSSADRMHWLDVDYASAAEAAVRCGMFKTALLFIEISVSETTRSLRRSSLSKSTEPQDILLSIFKNIDDPDIFYGLQQSASLSTVLERLEYENDGLKSLAFRGAQYDINLRRQDKSSTSDAQALVNALGMLSLDGLSHSLLQSQQNIGLHAGSVKSMFQTARKLEQWDLPIPAICDNEAVTLYKMFQAVNLAENRSSISHAIEEGLGSTMLALVQATNRAGSIRTSLQSLATLTEIDEVLSSSSSEQFEEMLGRFQNRVNWMETGRFDDVNHIMSCRETILSCLSQQSRLRSIVNINASDSRLVEVQTTLLSSSLSRAHGALQESLTSATYLTSLIEPCHALGLNIEAAAHLEAANALWEQGEMASSIGMLQALERNNTLKKQTIPVGKSDLLAKIGYQVSVARLEKPDRIVEKYLLPALKELKGKVDGSEAGQVFHEFAVFCDQQLQDADSLEDLVRLKRLKEMKASEVHDLGRMVKSATSSEQKAKYHAHLVKAKQWLQLDTEEYRRLSSSKDELLRQSLENYLLSLTASDGHNNDALRFTALWLEHSEEDIAIEPVSKHLSRVPTRKFASLMNQLTSRLLDNSDKFQQLLFSLVLRICVDHPYHGMYQIWAGFRSKSNTKDETAVSRQAATNKVAQQVATISRSAKIWSAINRTNAIYCQLASEKDEPRYKAGQKIKLKDSQAGSLLNSMLPRFSIPPPTLQVGIAANLDYSNIPVMCSLEPEITIASGVSAPKIISVLASNGSKFKQLVKGGNDDLRQDAIMEQVFGQVSELLRTNTSTRQRNLGIRTYKVLPLSSNAGIIEFVSNTIPLHEFLMPAHERYYPKDLKGSQCRKQIGDVQTQKLEVRVKTYRTVTEQFHPVMRYFFMEKFYNPDDWFARRLAYTRSTAAISILGHVLGLGDRHGHNILLDDKTGEVVHIDLGVAFEMGRVLPVPELVPFRLTRDIVDGMGITKTEGVYRRCCEFTLEALRKESYSIMMILDVLRYDPLYSWSISPVRLAKLQNAQSAAPVLSTAGEVAGGHSKMKEVVNEPSEADRALTVVKKKLSKTLSVTATVNDLINQATDERNLAVLYSGWAAYA